MRTSRSGRFLGGLLGATILITAALGAPALSLAANATVTYSLSLGADCVEGFAPTDAALHVVWKSSSGALKASADTTASSVSGYWVVCSANGSFVTAGDTLKAKIGSYTRKFTVPALTVNVNRVGDIFRGTAPAGKPLTLWYVFAGCCADFEQHEDLIADSAGKWSFDQDYATDGFYARVEWNSAKGDFVQAEDNAAAIRVVIGRSTIQSSWNPRSNFRVVLRDGKTNAKRGVARGTFDQYGYFSGSFLNANGKAVKVRVGDKIDGTSMVSDMKYTVRNIEISADVVSDVVSGRCLNPSARGTIEVFRGGKSVGTAHIGIGEDGSFSQKMSGKETLGFDPANIHHSDKVRVTCGTTKGDKIARSMIVP